MLIEFAETHLQGVNDQQPSDERLAFSKRQFENFSRLNAADQTRKHPAHSAFRATGNRTRRGWFWKKASVTRYAQVRGEHAGLTFKMGYRSVNVRFAEQHADVVGQVTSGKIVSAIDDHIVKADDVQGVYTLNSGAMQFHFDI